MRLHIVNIKKNAPLKTIVFLEGGLNFSWSRKGFSFRCETAWRPRKHQSLPRKSIGPILFSKTCFRKSVKNHYTCGQNQDPPHPPYKDCARTFLLTSLYGGRGGDFFLWSGKKNVTALFQRHSKNLQQCRRFWWFCVNRANRFAEQCTAIYQILRKFVSSRSLIFLSLDGGRGGCWVLELGARLVRC